MDMRPSGRSEQRAKRREQGSLLLEQGHGTSAVAARLGVSSRSVRRWRREAEEQRLRRRPGRPSRLDSEDLSQLERELKRGAYGHGYAEDYWTLDRIAQLIWQLFGLRYHPSGVWHLLHRLGWSCQKPQRRALQRDDEAIEHWKRYSWPWTRKVADPAGHACSGR